MRTEWEGLVPLKEVLETWSPAYPDKATWSQAFRSIMSWPSEAAIVETLRVELRAYGEFEEPIRLDHSEAEWDDGVFYPESRRVGNGMHRLTAAWLEGASKVLVSSSYPEAFEYVEVRFDLDNEPEENDETGEHWGFDWLRSFRLDANTWAEAAMCSSSSGTYSFLYMVAENKIPALTERIGSICAEHGVEFKLVSATRWEDDDDEEEN